MIGDPHSNALTIVRCYSHQCQLAELLPANGIGQRIIERTSWRGLFGAGC
jgi:hypothetical protein